MQAIVLKGCKGSGRRRRAGVGKEEGIDGGGDVIPSDSEAGVEEGSLLYGLVRTRHPPHR